MNKMNMKKRITKTMKTALLLAALAAITACSPATVPEGYDEAAVITQAENIVTLLSAGDYESVQASFREDLAGQLSAAQLEAAVQPEMERVGALVEFTQKEAASTKVEDTEYALVVIVAKHENSQATYTITMDQAGKLLGLYMR